MRILLIEDMPGFGRPVKAFLESQGHAVTWIIGAYQLQNSRLTGILANPNAGPMDDNWDNDMSRLIAVDLSQIEFALVDGGLSGPINRGEDIIPTLIANGITTVAISGGAGNEQLMPAGPHAGVPKEFLLLALRTPLLNPQTVRNNPDGVQQDLQAFAVRMRAAYAEAHGRGEKFDTGFECLQ